MVQLQSPLALMGRVMLAFMFVTSGWSKIVGYAGTQQYMEAVGVPGALLPLVILVELVGGLMVVFGLYTRLAALALAGFSVATAVLFHFDPADQMQMINFSKNVSIAGGFLVLAAIGAGAWSVDGWRRIEWLAPASPKTRQEAHLA